jgi:hypothetical protein
METSAKMRGLGVLTLAAGLLMVAVPMFAHHSQAVYDEDTLITLKGTVTQFEFVNPHVIIHLDVKDDKGNVESWECFSSPPGLESRAGWTSDMFKPGEELTILGFAEKGGRKVMTGMRHIRADGTEVTESYGEKAIYQGYVDRKAAREKAKNQ